MEEMKHYPVASTKENGEKNEKFTFVSIDNIILDPGMKSMGRQKCHKILLKKILKVAILRTAQAPTKSMSRSDF